MARALVELLGDSASAVRALEQTTGAVDATSVAFRELSVSAAKATEAIVAASSTRIARFQAEATAAQTLATQYAAVGKETEAAAASALASRRAGQAQSLLGQRVGTSPSLLAAAGAAGRGLTTYVTAPTAFIGYEAVKQAVDFNQQMLLLKTQAGDATDSIQQLSSQVLDLTKVAPQGPTTLAQGLFHLVSLGLRGAQAMDTLKVSSIAAGMGIANIEDTTSALGAAVVSGIGGAKNYQEAMSTLIATAGVGNMRFQDLASAIGNVLPSAAAAGVSLKEMGAALAVLTDRGMNADEAATRLRMSLALIQRPSAAATKALADMGVNADSLGVMIRQPGGLLKVLQTLHDAIDSVGAVRGNRDLLAAFGGARSGIGIQTLVQSLDSAISSYQGKLEQLGVQTQQVGANTQAYLESPAYKLHNALAQVQTDLVKLGTSLTPVVTGLAGAVKTMADGFSALPGPVKTDLGVIIGILAVGGPLLLAIKGVGAAVTGLGTLFAELGITAAPGIATTEGELATLGTTATTTTAEVSALRASLMRIASIGVITVGIEILIHRKQVSDAIGNAVKHATGSSGLGNAASIFERGAIDIASGGSLAGVDVANLFSGGKKPAPGGQVSPQLFPTLGPGVSQVDKAIQNKGMGAFTAAAKAYQAAHPSESPIGKFTLPYQIQVEQAKAQMTKSTADDMQTLRDVVAYTKKQIDSGRLSKAAYLQALQAEGSAEQQLYAAQTKDAKAATSAAKKAAEAAKKAGEFALSPALQLAQAQADAQAAIDPNRQGATAVQIRLAKEAKTQAMAAINSHTKTLQGLLQAWQIVQQANTTLATQMSGAANSYHAVSTRALTQGLDLTRNARILLEERLAQSAAHRGYAPSGPAAYGQPIVEVHLHGGLDQLVSRIEKKQRGKHQRAGARR